jgi:hypothetical protein
MVGALPPAVSCLDFFLLTPWQKDNASFDSESAKGYKNRGRMNIPVWSPFGEGR